MEQTACHGYDECVVHKVEVVYPLWGVMGGLLGWGSAGVPEAERAVPGAGY
jgi:hypothetical protein